jgi:maltoporin
MALFAVVAVGHSQNAVAQEKPAEKPPAETIAFKGYWRAQFNTAANPLQEAPSNQGTSAAPHSRHAYTANFWNLGVTKSMESGAQYAFKMSGSWPAKIAHEAGELSDIKVIDLYASMPVAQDVKIWAGAREFQFEDIRMLDFKNPFNVNAYGVGTEVDKASVILSFTKSKLARYDANGPMTSAPTASSPTASAVTTPGKDLTLVARYNLAISETLSVKPMLMVLAYGGAPENKALPANKVKGSTGVKVGAVVSHGTGGNSGHATLWVHSDPVDKGGNTSGSDMLIGLSHSSTWDFGVAGILTGLSVQSYSLKNKTQLFKVTDGAIVADGTNTTSSTVKVSLGVQPVYYVTDQFHAALDLNYATKTQKTTAADANMTSITPILRYAMNKNPVGSPQIYTSFTYGKYDAKVKAQTNGEFKDSLMTTQTGMEIWF